MCLTCLRLLERRASASQHNARRFLRYVFDAVRGANEISRPGGELETEAAAQPPLCAHHFSILLSGMIHITAAST